MYSSALYVLFSLLTTLALDKDGALGFQGREWLGFLSALSLPAGGQRHHTAWLHWT